MIKSYVIYEESTGKIKQTGQNTESAVQMTCENGDSYLIVESTNFDFAYVDQGELVIPPGKPSNNHEWDWINKGWVPNLEAAKTEKKAAIELEIAQQLYLPCNGFDADTLSRERITGMILRLEQGGGLPSGWMGWRDYNNNMHWATDDVVTVLNNLKELSRAIEDREQAVLVQGWTHKAAIASITDFEQLMNYNISVGWPT